MSWFSSDKSNDNPMGTDYENGYDNSDKAKQARYDKSCKENGLNYQGEIWSEASKKGNDTGI